MGRDTLNFKYSLISDMHVNHPQLKTPYDKLTENVVVAGDTANGLEGLRFLQKMRNKGFGVVATDGNHEHYSNVNKDRSVEETTKRFREEYPPLLTIDDTLSIVLCNGWYTVSDPYHWYNYMNDGRYAFGNDAIQAYLEINLLAVSDAKFIRETITNSPERKFIVVTHTSPCVETLDPRFEGRPGNQYYHNPYMREVLVDLKDQILVWNHGHTHHFQDKIVEGVRVVCNPRGYPGENPDWQPLTVTVEY